MLKCWTICPQIPVFWSTLYKAILWRWSCHYAEKFGTVAALNFCFFEQKIYVNKNIILKHNTIIWTVLCFGFLQYKKIPVVTENMDENLIITYSPKYKAYQRKIRSRQIERACISADLFIRTNQGWWYDWCILWKYIATRMQHEKRKPHVKTWGLRMD